MMKKIIFPLIAAVFMFTSCSDDDVATESTNNNAAIAGSYVLTSLIADVPVDLNQDMVTDMQLINETTCFDTMALNLDLNGTFTSTVAEVSFDAANVLQCTTNVETGTYTFANGVLTVTININGGTATESQQVTLTSTTLSFNVDDNDVTQFFTNTAGTPASAITSLDFIYTKI